MSTIYFYLKKIPSGEFQVLCRLQNGEDIQTKSTKRKVPAAKYWNATKQQAKNIPEQTEINDQIDAWKQWFKNYIKDCSNKQQDPSMLFAKQHIDKGELPDMRLFTEVLKMKIEELKYTHKLATIKTYNNLYTQVKKYEEKINKSLYLSDINDTFYLSYTQYLIESENNTNNSIIRKIVRIQTVMKYAVRKKFIKTTDHVYKQDLKGTPSNKIALRPDELAVLEAYTEQDPYRAMVLDSFLLACYTGLRHSDMVLIKPANVIKIQDVTVLDLTQFKGSKQNTIPLGDRALAIIHKYSKAAHNPLFTYNKSQAASRILKAICRGAKLTRPCEIITAKSTIVTREIKPLHNVISFHMGRNTYITSLLSKGLPAVFVKDNVGHADIRTTMGYSKQDDVLRWQETLRILNKTSSVDTPEVEKTRH